MTNKQIIIDGVDVNQCKYFNSYQKIVRNNECIVDIQNACVEEIETKPCSQKHNCYFKNWQRKEQEHKETQKALAKCWIENGRLKKECEELKEELNKKYIQEGIKTYCPFFFRDTATCLGRDLNEIGQLKFCRKYHNCWIKKIAKENIQLKQTLAEIKGIAQEQCNICETLTPIDEYKNCKICKQGVILQKINECEVEDVENN